MLRRIRGLRSGKLAQGQRVLKAGRMPRSGIVKGIKGKQVVVKWDAGGESVVVRGDLSPVRRYRAVFGFRVSAATPEIMEEELHGVLEALDALEVEDPDVGGSLTQGAVEVSFIVACTQNEARTVATEIMRKAITKAGGQVWEPDTTTMDLVPAS
jgi:hypothetical protein